ncbi:MAG: aminopeptidase P family protein, partial [Anaerolineales bacterium]|nr:aminopeptidase P family protein [Anaerolineales bacterium]
MRDNITTQRISAVRNLLNEWRVEAVYITSETNRRWLSGFTGSNGQLLITKEHALLATDFRYWEQAQQQAPAYTLFKHQRTTEDTVQFFTETGATRIGIEANHLTLQAATDLKNNNALSHLTWVPLPQTVESLRAVKNSDEIAAIQAAAAITDHTMSQVNLLARPGISEKELAWELEKVMRDAGAEATAFTLIVASGPNSALPHHRPGKRLLQAGDTIVVDMGAQLDGYKSDLTRSFYLGSEPNEQFWAVYNKVLEAQTAVIQQTRPGMTCKEIDGIARNM